MLPAYMFYHSVQSKSGKGVIFVTESALWYTIRMKLNYLWGWDIMCLIYKKKKHIKTLLPFHSITSYVI